MKRLGAAPQVVEHLGDLRVRGGADGEGDELEPSEHALQKGELHLEAVLGGMGGIEDVHLRMAQAVVDGDAIEWNLSERRGEGVGVAGREAIDAHAVGGSEQDDPFDASAVWLDGGVDGAGDRTRVHVPGVRRDDRPWAATGPARASRVRPAAR